MRVRLSPARLVAAARSRTAGHTREEGFSIVEAIVGLTLIFGAMLVILTGLNTGIRGLLTGRQRQTATTVAKEIMEDLRRACYDRIGHDYNDPTLATDAALSQSGGIWYFNSEKLARATTSSSCTGTAAVPVHSVSSAGDGTPYAALTYVTNVEPTGANSGVRHKRVTVIVQWDREQYDASVVQDTIRLSSLVFDGQPPGGTSGGGGGTSAFPITTATAKPVAGSFTYSGTLVPTSGGDSAEFLPSTITYPDAYAWLRTNLVDEAKGDARTHAWTIEDAQGGLSVPLGCTASGNKITCPASSNSSASDSDGATSPAPAFWDTPTAASVPSRTVSKPNSLYSVTVGTGTADTKSTACAGPSCASFGSPPEVDGLPHGLHTGNGPNPHSLNFNLGGGISGKIIQSSAADARAEVDQDAGSPYRRTTARARNTYPAVSLLQLLNTDLLGLGSALDVVSVPSFWVETTADIGPGSSGATCTRSSSFNITVLGGAGFVTVPITPCITAMNQTYASSVSIINPLPVASVETSVTIVSKPYAETETSEPGGFKKADARLEDWLTISFNFEVSVAGQTIADIDGTLYYGDLTAFAERTP